MQKKQNYRFDDVGGILKERYSDTGDPLLSNKSAGNIFEDDQNLTASTPLGDTKMPLPMMEPTMTVQPFIKVIFGFSSTFSPSWNKGK